MLTFLEKSIRFRMNERQGIRRGVKTSNMRHISPVNGNNIVLNSTSDSKSVSPINNNNNTNKISPVPENAQERSTSNDNVQEKAIFDLVDSS